MHGPCCKSFTAQARLTWAYGLLFPWLNGPGHNVVFQNQKCHSSLHSTYELRDASKILKSSHVLCPCHAPMQGWNQILVTLTASDSWDSLWQCGLLPWDQMAKVWRNPNSTQARTPNSSSMLECKVSPAVSYFSKTSMQRSNSRPRHPSYEKYPIATAIWGKKLLMIPNNKQPFPYCSSPFPSTCHQAALKQLQLSPGDVLSFWGDKNWTKVPTALPSQFFL